MSPKGGHGSHGGGSGSHDDGSSGGGSSGGDPPTGGGGVSGGPDSIPNRPGQDDGQDGGCASQGICRDDVPSHDTVPNQNDKVVSDKGLPPNAGDEYQRRLRTFRPSFIRGPKELGITKRCRLGDRDVDDVGHIEIEGTSDALKGVSWSEGVADYRSPANEEYILKNFYLGVPGGKNLADVGGCAVFFTNVSDSVAFVGDEKKGPHGSCDWALSEKCVEAMIKRAQKVKTDGSVKDTCERLGKEFEKNLDKECEDAAGSRWDSLVVKALPEQLGSDKKLRKSKDCWPAKDQETDLALIASINQKIPTPSIHNMDDPTGDLIQFSVMPILTFFYPGDGKLLSRSETHMTCIKPVAQNEKVNGEVVDPEDPNSGASHIGARGWDAGMLLVTIWLMMALLGMRPRSR